MSRGGDGQNRIRVAQTKARRKLSRALEIVYSDAPIRNVGGDVYEVPSRTVGGKYYPVNLRRQTCTCPDWRKRGGRCIHIEAAALHRSREMGTAAPAVNGRPVPHPRHYERVRTSRRACLRTTLRCVGTWVNANA